MQVESFTTDSGLLIEGPLICTPRVFGDARGYFLESWNAFLWKETLAKHGQEACSFVQDNQSRSSKGVLRGLHFQLPPHPQGKLVRCVFGEIFDVAVDLRRSSSTFGQWGGVFLSETNHRQLWIPEGFAHGFLTISEYAEVLYKTSDFWRKECERSIRWDDQTLGICWPDNCGIPKLSSKDEIAPRLDHLALSDFFP